MSNAGAYLTIGLVLTAVAGSANGTRSCSRWNCPCSGSGRPIKRAQEKRWYQNYHIDAENARRHTKQILDRLINERFHDDDHITLLQDCSDHRNPHCTNTHLRSDCSMAGLPTLPMIQRLGVQDFTTHPTGVISFATQSRGLLAKLAVFIDQARRDEERYTTNRHQSLAEDIRQLEEQHVYHMLCNLHVDFSRKQIRWNADVTRDLMQLSCRLLNDQAPTDNRNFMIFYTLEMLLRNMATQFQRVMKRDVTGVVPVFAKTRTLQVDRVLSRP